MHLCTCLAPRMAHAVHRLYHGIHSSQGEDQHIHYSAQGDHHSECRSLQAFTSTSTESIWLEGQPGHLARAHQEGAQRMQIHALQSRSLPFIRGSVLLVLYTDDAAFVSPSAQAVDDEIASLKKAFDLTYEGELQDYLGTRFIRHTDGQMELQQQKSIDNCLNLLGMGKDKENDKLHDTPAELSKILHADLNGMDRKQIWNFHAVMGCLNYLQAMTRPDLSYSVHQCARFCNSPKLSHEQALKRICHLRDQIMGWDTDPITEYEGV